MLNAILCGKKRGSGFERKSLADSFVGAEDLLTSTVFERLLYLPDEIVADCLFSCFKGCPEPCGGIVSAEFWPRRQSAVDVDSEISNGSFEPDMLIEWADRILIIEAKRFDYANLQKSEQLAQEYSAVSLAHPDKSIYLLAIGGLTDTRPETVASLCENMISLLPQNGTIDKKIISGCFTAVPWFKLSRKMEAIIEPYCKQHSGIRRLLVDMRNGFMLHGVSTTKPVWLSEILSGFEQLISDSSIQYFACALPSNLSRIIPGTQTQLNDLVPVDSILTSPRVFATSTGESA